MFVCNFNPIAFTIFGIDIKWYSLPYLFGALVISLIAYSLDQKKEIFSKITPIDCYCYGLMSVIIGARLVYVFFYYPSYFLSHPWKILNLWTGGMSFHGGAIGLMLFCIFIAHKTNTSVKKCLDCVAMGAPIAIALGRLANFVNCELCGKPTNMAFGVIFENIDDLPRHPNQLYEAILEGPILLCICILFHKKNKRDGIVAATFCFFYGIFRFMTEFIRELEPQAVLIFQLFTMGQILSIPMIAISLIWLVNLHKAKTTNDN